MSSEKPRRQDQRTKFEHGLNAWFSEKDTSKIMSAYDLAEKAHHGIKRYSGVPFFEHPKAAANILLEVGIRNTDMICAAFLHDVPEDTTILGDPKVLGYTSYIRCVRKYIEKRFSKKTAGIVVSLTEPPIDGTEILDKEVAREMKHDLLETASPAALMVKMADRLDNLRTFYYREDRPTPEAKIVETKALMPIFERALSWYPEEARFLLDEIQKTMDALEVEFGLDTTS